MQTFVNAMFAITRRFRLLSVVLRVARSPAHIPAAMRVRHALTTLPARDKMPELQVTVGNATCRSY